MRITTSRMMFASGLVLVVVLLLNRHVSAELTLNARPSIAPSNPCFVGSLYLAIFNRAPDSSEMANDLTYLGHATRTAYASNLFGGSLYQTTLIRSWYRRFLGRPATNPEIDAGLTAFAGNATDEQIIAGLLGSPEYFTLARVGGTNSGFVSAIYQDLLQRPADPTGLSFWTGQLESHAKTRLQVAQFFLSDTEYRTLLIQGLYQKFLGRPASTGEVNAGLSAFGSGAKDEDLSAGVAGSDEYFNLAGICSLYLPMIAR